MSSVIVRVRVVFRKTVAKWFEPRSKPDLAQAELPYCGFSNSVGQTECSFGLLVIFSLCVSDSRVQLEEQHQQKVKSAVERTKEEKQKEKEAAVQAARDQTARKQQELWSKEKRTNQTEMEKLKQELTRLKKDYEQMVEKAKRVQAAERKKERVDGRRKEEYPVQVGNH